MHHNSPSPVGEYHSGTLRKHRSVTCRKRGVRSIAETHHAQYCTCFLLIARAIDTTIKVPYPNSVYRRLLMEDGEMGTVGINLWYVVCLKTTCHLLRSSAHRLSDPSCPPQQLPIILLTRDILPHQGTRQHHGPSPKKISCNLRKKRVQL